MKEVVEISSKAKRVVGTVNDSMEKYLYRDEAGGAAAWGMTIVKMDVPVETLFTYIWLLDTYAKKVENEGSEILEVWKNLDGTRSLQYDISIGLPGGFQDRLFKIWTTWEKRVDEDGRRTFIIAFAPMEDYKGTSHKVAGSGKMVEATSKGVQIIKELNNNTCEWTMTQQADLKIGLPANRLDFIAKQQMGWCKVRCSEEATS
ncbi:hypothetical protein TL16_g09797 [Triparma laevis f. inornata]|uniref:Uncharacterized protein n=1 Tax=Triparma laevis f. inornata TaxID=1714386 RepID=A0A9W7EMK7_9STRA|nr:hypothetical protein TL16_g09797 [Triparma laevis f. inornata]